jgi:hypothetical protein
MKRTKKAKPTPITSLEMYDAILLENDEATTTEKMIAFAKQKVTEALHETSEHFKNADNVSYIKNHYSLDKIV